MTITKRLSKGSALTHTEMDANFDHVTSHISTITSSAGSASVGFIQTSSAIARTVEGRLRDYVSVLDFIPVELHASIADGTNTTDLTSYILQAIVSAKAVGKGLLYPGGTYLFGSQLALTSSHNSVPWNLVGAVLKKGFSGNMVTLTGTSFFGIEGIGTIDGQHGTYTGKGFVFSGAGTIYPHFGSGITFDNFTDSHIEFGANAGQYAKIFCDFQPGSGQTSFRAVHCTGTDTEAMYRKWIGNTATGGYHDLDGAWDSIFSGASFQEVRIDSNCNITAICNCIWGNTSTVTISGSHNTISDCRFSESVILDSNFTGIWGQNRFTALGAGLTNESAVALVEQGQPYINFASAIPGASVGATTDETALATIEVPAKFFRANDCLKITCYWNLTDGANDKILRIRYGANGAGLGGTQGLSYTATTSNAAKTETLIHGFAATNSQLLISEVITGGSVPVALLSNITTSAIDTTAASEIVISGQKENSGETLQLYAYQVEIVRVPPP